MLKGFIFLGVLVNNEAAKLSAASSCRYINMYEQGILSNGLLK